MVEYLCEKDAFVILFLFLFILNKQNFIVLNKLVIFESILNLCMSDLGIVIFIASILIN